MMAVYLTEHGYGPFADPVGLGMSRNFAVQVYLGFHLIGFLPISILFLQQRHMDQPAACPPTRLVQTLLVGGGVCSGSYIGLRIREPPAGLRSRCVASSSEMSLSGDMVRVGVEMGGTKCICTLGTGPDDIRAQQAFPTQDPQTTLGAIANLLDQWRGTFGEPASIGVASFGPVDLRQDSPTYGWIGATPKELWQHFDLLGFFRRRFAVPVGLTTDVIGAALAEARWGAARGLTDHAYVTVGTGVGVGLVMGGKPLIGRHHPELGHVRIPRLAGDDWPGNCPFHGDCVEGLASGPAIQARSGRPGPAIPADDPVWDSVAHALAQLAHVLTLSVAPQRILMGGGVMTTRPELFPRIRQRLALSLNGYLGIHEVTDGLETYIGPPGLGDNAGPLGALAVAADAQMTVGYAEGLESTPCRRI
jgi:fructokinase